MLRKPLKRGVELTYQTSRVKAEEESSILGGSAAIAKSNGRERAGTVVTTPRGVSFAEWQDAGGVIVRIIIVIYNSNGVPQVPFAVKRAHQQFPAGLPGFNRDSLATRARAIHLARLPVWWLELSCQIVRLTSRSLISRIPSSVLSIEMATIASPACRWRMRTLRM
jgi:hypothetical protein